MSVPSPYIYKLKQAVLWLTRPHLLFFALPYLMVILTAGTVAQKDIGLYAAQERYFSSLIFWFGPIPLPGSLTILGMIFISLTAKFLLASPWSRAQAGTLLTHLGILLLLFGGLLTALTAREDFIVIPEGGTSSTISSYHERALAVEKEDGTVIAAWRFSDLERGAVLTVPDTPLSIKIEKTCRNCTAQLTADDRGRHGMAEKMDLIDTELHTEDEMNISGVTFTVSGSGADTDGTYITLQNITVRPQIGEYFIFARRAQESLPFSIRLEDFVEERHPGTVTPRAFHSDVTVIENGIDWPVRIEMNEPLRYKGYTFYQSSFTRDENGNEETVLAVVRNAGRIFPYVACAIIFAGLLVHLVIRLRGSVKTEAA